MKIPPLRIDRYHSPKGFLVLVLRGSLIKKALTGELDPKKTWAHGAAGLFINLSGVREIDRTGLELLVGFVRESQERNTFLAFYRPNVKIRGFLHQRFPGYNLISSTIPARGKRLPKKRKPQDSLTEPRELWNSNDSKHLGFLPNLPKVLKDTPKTVKPSYGKVLVFYATDRNRTAKSIPSDFYGKDRGNEDLSLGTCEVSIPLDHRIGELESPSFVHLQFKSDPKRHVALLAVAELEKDQFWSHFREKTGHRDVMVFVHGFNVSFEDGARRTAQLAYDLQLRGTPILYSWPSEDRLKNYFSDSNNIEWTYPHLQQFLEDLSARSGTGSIHLIAHSMGNRALTRDVTPLLRPVLTVSS